GLSEVVADGRSGFLVPPNDPAALRQRINAILGDHDLAERLGAEGRRRILERFTWDQVADRCLQTYAELDRRHHGATGRALMPVSTTVALAYSTMNDLIEPAGGHEIGHGAGAGGGGLRAG